MSPHLGCLTIPLHRQALELLVWESPGAPPLRPPWGHRVWVSVEISSVPHGSKAPVGIPQILVRWECSPAALPFRPPRGWRVWVSSGALIRSSRGGFTLQWVLFAVETGVRTHGAAWRQGYPKEQWVQCAVGSLCSHAGDPWSQI